MNHGPLLQLWGHLRRCWLGSLPMGCRFRGLSVRSGVVFFREQLTENLESITFFGLDPGVSYKGIEVKEAWVVKL